MTNRLTTIAHHPHDHHDEEIDEEDDKRPSEPFLIFDADYSGEEVPAGFNAVRVPIDGTIKADLDWISSKEAAKKYIEKGLNILWDINLGLFQHLIHSLGNQSQFLSLVLSLEHFRDTLWQPLRAHSIGLCLYRGASDMSQGFRWDHEQESNLQHWLQDLYKDIDVLSRDTDNTFKDFQEITPDLLSQSDLGKQLLMLFCRDAAGEYLNLLADRLPDALRCFLFLDIRGIKHPLLAAQLISKERYPRFCIGVKGTGHFDSELSCEGSSYSMSYFGRHLIDSKYKAASSIGICLPDMTRCHPREHHSLNFAMMKLQQHYIVYRVIPESLLTTEWDCLDVLIVEAQSLNHQGKRKLQGFCAAGGSVVTVDQLIGLPEEIAFAEWCHLQNIV